MASPSIPEKAPSFPSRQRKAFRQALHEWFKTHQRPLPWRQERSLYRTVVSEFMLQQTQIKTALPAFHAWMQTFPDFLSLARASEASVLKAWEGLGYYRRARNLHKLAQILITLPEIPPQPSFWKTLPGVGDYTAAAITSLSFHAPQACVDGNVVRILARLTRCQTPFSDSGKAVKAMTPLAQALLDNQHPGLHNEAMMELGATVCLRHKPACLLCPVRSFCPAASSGDPEAFPRLIRPHTIKQTKNLLWLGNAEGLFLWPSDSGKTRLSGLYEFPEWEALLPDVPPDPAQQIDQRTRSITRYRITETLYAAPTTVSRQISPACPCIPWSDLAKIPMSGPHRKWLNALLHPTNQSVSYYLPE